LLNNIKEEEINPKRFIQIPIDDDVQAVLQNYSFNENEKLKIHYEESGGFSYLGDSNLTQVMLTNLLRNALYHIELENKGEIYISFKADDNNNYLIFSDTGPGIPAQLLPRIFDRFVTGRCGGTGLGLAFCKLVMNAYGGDITCSSKEGEGAEFVLAFPKITQH
jgi:two-component system, CAI-1 autoinducer sensor kinase/phosphatase CqsS